MLGIAPRPIIADENASSENPVRLKGTASRGFGLGGLGGKGAALQPLGQKGIGKPTSKGQQGHEPGARPVRRAFGDLTNATLSSNTSSAGNGGKVGAKPQQAQQLMTPAAQEYEPAERSFGKGWRDMQAELDRQDAARQAAYAQQLKRVVASASTWSLSHLTPLQVYEDGQPDAQPAGSDEEDNVAVPFARQREEEGSLAVLPQLARHQEAAATARAASLLAHSPLAPDALLPDIPCGQLGDCSSWFD